MQHPHSTPPKFTYSTESEAPYDHPVHCYFNPAVLWNCDAAHQQASKPPDTQLSGHYRGPRSNFPVFAGRQRHRRPNRQRICHRRCGIRRPLRHCGRLVWYRLRAFLLYHCGPVPFHPHPSLCLPGRLFCPPLQRSCDPYDLYCRKYLLQRFSAGRAASGRKDHIPDIGPSGPVGCRPDCGYRAGILKRRRFMGVYGSLLHPERHYLYRNVHSPVSDDVRSRSWDTGSRSACFQLSSSALWRRIFSLYDCSHRFGKLSEPDLIPERRLCQIPQIGQRRLSSGRTDIDPGRIHSAPAGHVRARFVSRYSR